MSHSEVKNYESKFQDTWTKFKRALHSTEHFDTIYWINILVFTALQDCSYFLDRKILSPYLRWKAIIPVISICLILLVIVAFFIFYDWVVEEEWCNNRSCKSNDHFCRWRIVHVIFVIYLSIMVYWNFCITVFTSPGVALPKLDKQKEEEKENFGTAFKSNTKETKNIMWKSFEGRGGLLCFNPVPVNINVEMTRVKQFTPSNDQINLYKEVMNSHSSKPHLINDNNIPNRECFPSPLPSYCHKCNVVHPPRCRHCKLCNRCVLQKDHHCPWMNNCIGYANYRSFLLCLFYLVLGGWYGLILAFIPFLQTIKSQFNKWSWIKQAQSFPLFAIPPTCSKFQQPIFFKMSIQEYMFVLYPSLMSISFVLSFFFYLHLKQISKGRTTAEQIQLQKRNEIKYHKKLTTKKQKKEEPWNIFHQGFIKNLQLIVGPNIYLIFIPYFGTSDPPFILSLEQMEQKKESYLKLWKQV